LNAADKVIKALEHPDFRWRTHEGIAQDTGLPEQEIHAILVELARRNELVQASVTDKHGHELFTTRRHYFKKTGLINRVLALVTDKVR
jgi:hypothetical protein